MTAVAPASESVSLETGTWSFAGWDAKEKTIGGGDLTFTGTWTFKEKVQRWKRLAGAGRYDTMAAIGVAHVAVATGKNFPDALAGSALCGHNMSVLLLATDSDRTAVDAVVGPRAGQVDVGYVFGGESAVSRATLAYCEALTE